MGGSVTIDGTEQQSQRETTAGTFTAPLDCKVSLGVDVAVEVTGAATLTMQLSTTGDFSGEEIELTADYDSAGEYIEQVGNAHRFIRAKVNQNLADVECIRRGV